MAVRTPVSRSAHLLKLTRETTAKLRVKIDDHFLSKILPLFTETGDTGTFYEAFDEDLNSLPEFNEPEQLVAHLKTRMPFNEWLIPTPDFFNTCYYTDYRILPVGFQADITIRHTVQTVISCEVLSPGDDMSSEDDVSPSETYLSIDPSFLYVQQLTPIGQVVKEMGMLPNDVAWIEYS